MEDRVLVETTLADPARGVAAIYDAYGQRLYNYCLGILRSGDDAADALQDTFISVHEKLAQLRDPDKLRPWLYAVARSHCFKRTRRRGREAPTDEIEATVAPTGDAGADAVASADLAALVWDAAAGLSDVDRSVIELNVRHGLEGEELADGLGVTASRAYVMLHRAKARLETSVGSLLVARAGTADCAELAQIVGGQDFSPLVRKRVARHVRSCATCEDTSRRNRPEALLALVPMVAVPSVLRSRVLASFDPGTSGSGPPDGDLALDWDDRGFPSPQSSRRRTIVRSVAAGGIAATVVAVVGFVPLGDNGEDEVRADPTTTVSSTVAAPAPSPSPTIDDIGESPTIPPTVAPTTSLDPGGEPPPGGGTEPPEPTTPTTPPTAPLTSSVPFPPFVDDVSAPEVALLEPECGDPFVVTVTVEDDFDDDPTVELSVTWEDESDPPIALAPLGGAIHGAEVDRNELVGESIEFFVRGTATDIAGNRADVDESVMCRVIN